MKSILAVMNATYVVKEIRPEKKIQTRTGFETMASAISVQCSNNSTNKTTVGGHFSRLYFHCYISNAHYCNDPFHTFHEAAVHNDDFHLIEFIVITWTGLTQTNIMTSSS